MIRHFCKMVWNRRRKNGLILMELTISFLVLCGVLTMASYYALNWNKPLGFEYENLWRLDLDLKLSRSTTEEELAATQAGSEQLLRIMGDMAEIEAATPLDPNFPYTNAMSLIGVFVNGNRELIGLSTVSIDAIDALRWRLIDGRWFEEGDEILNWTPVVVTEDAAKMLYGDENPLGKILPTRDPGEEIDDSEADENEMRIVGILAEYRMRSELRPAYMNAFVLYNPRDGYPQSVYAVRTTPGVTAEFERELRREVAQIDPRWTMEFTPVTQVRHRELKGNLLPLMIFGVVAVFLIFMAGLGLVGVLWQAVTRRTEEMGIRRALGATARRVQWQILGELLVLTTIGVLIGSAIFLQMPILQIIGWIPWAAYLLSLGVSLVIIYFFVLLCGLYPSWLATRIHPAEALQYE